MRVLTEDGQGNVISDIGIQSQLKSTYTKEQFIAKIPKGKIREIQVAASTNDDINVWVFNLPMLDVIDLNSLPAWFIEGLQGMVTEGIFTQNQMNSFLEV